MRLSGSLSFARLAAGSPLGSSALWAAISLSACNWGAQDAGAPPVAATPPAATSTTKDTVVPPVVAAHCDEPTPHFSFGSTEVQPGMSRELRDFVRCLKQFEPDQRKVTLVGRADARGSYSYNQGLALRRAESVKGLLLELGLAGSQVVIRSSGERGAMGAGRGEYADDRRVDIFGPDDRVTLK